MFSILWGWLVYGPLALLILLNLGKGRKNENAHDNHQLDAINRELANLQMAQPTGQSFAAQPMSDQASRSSAPASFGKRR